MTRGGHNKGRPDLTDEDYKARIEANCQIEPFTGCWLWQGFVHKPPNPYGATSYRGKNWRVHRLAYFLWKGPLNPVLDVCHSCDVKCCCNPDHLWQGTPKANMQDAAQKMIWSRQHQTHCKSGHEFTPENTYRSPATPNKRRCRECDRLKNKNPSYVAWRREYQRLKRDKKRA